MVLVSLLSICLYFYVQYLMQPSSCLYLFFCLFQFSAFFAVCTSYSVIFWYPTLFDNFQSPGYVRVVLSLWCYSLSNPSNSKSASTISPWARSSQCSGSSFELYYPIHHTARHTHHKVWYNASTLHCAGSRCTRSNSYIVLQHGAQR